MTGTSVKALCAVEIAVPDLDASVDPNNFVIEYTSQMQQIDDATHVPGTAETITRPSHSDLWELTDPPSERFLRATEGQPRRDAAADA
jgi:hypothetical protein